MENQEMNLKEEHLYSSEGDERVIHITHIAVAVNSIDIAAWHELFNQRYYKAGSDSYKKSVAHISKLRETQSILLNQLPDVKYFLETFPHLAHHYSDHEDAPKSRYKEEMAKQLEKQERVD